MGLDGVVTEAETWIGTEAVSRWALAGVVTGGGGTRRAESGELWAEGE